MLLLHADWIGLVQLLSHFGEIKVEMQFKACFVCCTVGTCDWHVVDRNVHTHFTWNQWKFRVRTHHVHTSWACFAYMQKPLLLAITSQPPLTSANWPVSSSDLYVRTTTIAPVVRRACTFVWCANVIQHGARKCSSDLRVVCHWQVTLLLRLLASLSLSEFYPFRVAKCLPMSGVLCCAPLTMLVW